MIPWFPVRQYFLGKIAYLMSNPLYIQKDVPPNVSTK